MKKGIFVCLLIAGISLSKELPITKVILYKNGIGYFERAGKVNDNDVINLSFKKDEFSDVLKSLVAIDLKGGNIPQAEYPSNKPIDKLLEEFSFTLFPEDNLLSLLNQIKGCELELKIGEEFIKGKILGLRKKGVFKDNLKIEVDILDIVGESGRLKSIALDEIKEIKLRNERMEKELNDYLNIVFLNKKKEKRELSIFANGKGERPVVISYISEVPVWKTSYRVVNKQNGLFFQGWAIIDNLSDNDWDNVSLSLVSGKPISFISDLYSPIYKKRPRIGIEEEEEKKPVIPERGIFKSKALMKGEKETREAFSLQAMEERMRESQEIKTVTKEIGDLFEYKISYPVTIPANKSALIPIAQGEIEGKRVSLYNETNNPKNPLSTIYLKNTTQLTLDGGPITVYEEESYAGEGIIKTLKPDEKGWITYGVDLGVEVDTSRGTERKNVHHVSIVQGTLYAYYKNIDIKTYNLRNKTNNQKKVVIEHPFRRDWSLQKPKPNEETPNYYRFNVDILPKGSSSVLVKEERVFCETYILTNITSDNIEFFVKMNYISPDLKRIFEKIVELKSKINDIKTKIKTKEKRCSDIFNDQQRLRENLKVLKDTPQERKLSEEYVSKLSLQEKELEDLKKEIQKLQNEGERYSSELDKIIKNISLEKDIKN